MKLKHRILGDPQEDNISVSDWIMVRTSEITDIPIIRPRLFCKDGFSVSVQAGRYLYSRPRSYEGPFTHVEVGFPSDDVPELYEYLTNDNWETGVYAYVPIDLVEDLVERHGGIDTSIHEDASTWDSYPDNLILIHPKLRRIDETR